MKGTVSDIVDLFDGTDTELVIPVYQRNYDWTQEQCAQLFDDLEDVIANDRIKHFFGAAVGNPETKTRWVVIDGQQRITTVSLLILALTHALDAGEIDAKEPELSRVLREKYLLGKNWESGRAKVKLKPVKDDFESYRRLLTDGEPIERANTTANYRYFRERLRETSLTGDEVWKAISKLEAMTLDLEPHDEPQRIFESLNSTGKSLAESDKIRNLVLMGHPVETQNRLYEDYWNRIERNVSFHTDAFVRSYLTSRTRKTPRFDALYGTFKKFHAEDKENTETTLKSMREYSEYYRDLNSATTGVARADRRLRRFNLVRHEVAMPTLMPLLGDYRSGAITGDDFADAIELIDSYNFRRSVVGLQTNALNKIFATLYSEARRIRNSDAPITDVLVYLLMRRANSSGAFPDDQWFREEFATRNFYKFNTENRQYLFECLENLNSKDTVSIAQKLAQGDLSVEHVMPQTLTNRWREELGPNAEDIHQTWLHRIGNLTVTGYNSEYSNASFQEKKLAKDGFNESPYRLNHLIKQADSWGVEEMRQRTAALVEAALAYWPMPTTDFEPKRPPMPRIPLGDDNNFTNQAIVSFEFNGESRPVKSYTTMAHLVIKSLLTQRREEIYDYAAGKSFGFTVGEQPAIRSQVEVAPQLWMRLNNSTAEKLTVLRNLFHHLDIDTDDLIITLRPATKAKETEEEPTGPYANLIEFLPQFEELEGTDPTDDDLSDLRRQFNAAFEPLAPDNWQDTIKGRSLPHLTTPDVIASLSAEEVLAAIQMLRYADRMMPGEYLNRVKDGTLAAWLRRLEETQ